MRLKTSGSLPSQHSTAVSHHQRSMLPVRKAYTGRAHTLSVRCMASGRGREKSWSELAGKSPIATARLLGMLTVQALEHITDHRTLYLSICKVEHWNSGHRSLQCANFTEPGGAQRQLLASGTFLGQFPEAHPISSIRFRCAVAYR